VIDGLIYAAVPRISDALVTTFNSQANRVAMHAVRRLLVEAQAEQTGLPL
jgi:hypothetical protein